MAVATQEGARTPSAVSRRRVPAGRPPLLVAAAAVGAFLGRCAVLRGFVTDDSWISVRCAEDLARGHGPVWNPGGERAALAAHPSFAAYRLAHTGSGGSGCGYHLLAYRR